MSTVLYEPKGAVVRITLNRPEAMNAFDLPTARELGRRLEEFDRDDALRVAIVTGAGDKAFCAGADLKQMHGGSHAGGIDELWGSEIVAVHGSSLRPAELGGFIAERSRRVVGLLTYQLVDTTLEIVTLNAIDRRAGIGTMLIEAAVDKARRFGCREIRLTTTNDNVDALRFYQRRGFRMAELRPGAVDQSRQRKPQIPRVGDYGIPLHDEIDLTRPV